MIPEAQHPDDMAKHLPKEYDYAFCPTLQQFNVWRNCVDWSASHDPHGWWRGECPLHRDPLDTEHGADFNFSKGTIRCDITPRAVSLNNVMRLIAERVLNAG